MAQKFVYDCQSGQGQMIANTTAEDAALAAAQSAAQSATQAIQAPLTARSAALAAIQAKAAIDPAYAALARFVGVPGV